jgi:curved DNA-binding protein CbpA
MHSDRGVTETSGRRARWRGRDRRAGAVSEDPFAALGLPTRAGLSDDDVRAGWRRIAAATHPDREDGGDPARFGVAATAYAALRTEFGRGEMLADLGLGGQPDHRRRHGHRLRRTTDTAARAGRHRARQVSGEASRLRWRPERRPGRPGGLVGRVAGAVAVGLVAVAISGWSPGVVGVLAGVLTWLVATAARALSRRRPQ